MSLVSKLESDSFTLFLNPGSAKAFYDHRSSVYFTVGPETSEFNGNDAERYFNFLYVQ